MALEGTFSDFGLAEIFQLIGLQKKTGVLTVRGGEDGQVVAHRGLALADGINEIARTRLARG